MAAAGRVSAEKSGHGMDGGEHDLLLPRGTYAYMQEQGFEDFGLEQGTQVIGGQSRVIASERSTGHALAHEGRHVRPVVP